MIKARNVYIQRHRCTGCQLCSLVCPNTVRENSQVESARIRVITGDIEGFSLQICRNCEDAPCYDACPAGAITRRKQDDHVIVLEERCIRCNMCVMVCPFNAISTGSLSNAVCDTCEGSEKCAKVCEHEAICFMDISKFSRIRRRKSLDRMSQEQEK